MFRKFAAMTVIAAPLMSTANATDDVNAIADADLREFMVDFREGTRLFMNGDPVKWKNNVSHSEDTMIMGAWGAYEKGWPEASARYDWAAARFKDSTARLDVEYLASGISGDLAYTVALEHAEVLLAGQDKPKPMSLRVTHIFRKEGGTWKLLLRHADPLVAKTATETVLNPATR